MNATNPENLKPEQIIKVLVAHGFYRKRVQGDHAIYSNSETQKAMIVTLGRKTFSSSEILTIAKQSGVPRKSFKKM